MKGISPIVASMILVIVAVVLALAYYGFLGGIINVQSSSNLVIQNAIVRVYDTPEGMVDARVTVSVRNLGSATGNIYAVEIDLPYLDSSGTRNYATVTINLDNVKVPGGGAKSLQFRLIVVNGSLVVTGEDVTSYTNLTLAEFDGGADWYITVHYEGGITDQYTATPKLTERK